MNFRDYLYMMLGLPTGDSEQVPRVRRVKKEKSNDKQVTSHTQVKPFKLLKTIVIIITWFMIVAALISLGAIIYLPITGVEVPSSLPQVLFSALGYLGGVLASFANFATSNRE